MSGYRSADGSPLVLHEGIHQRGHVPGVDLGHVAEGDERSVSRRRERFDPGRNGGAHSLRERGVVNESDREIGEGGPHPLNVVAGHHHHRVEPAGYQGFGHVSDQ